MAKRLLLHINSTLHQIRNENSCRQILSGVVNRCLSQSPKSDREEESTSMSIKTKVTSSDDDELTLWKWKLELDWLSKALEPALQLYKWASSTRGDENNKIPPNSMSFSEILRNLQRSKISIQDWSLSDFTVGLYLIYLSQASADKAEQLKGIQIFSESIVQELIYHLELAKGSYKDSPSALAKHSMLREKNIVKFIKDSSVMRPGYYLGVDTRNSLVVLGIRGTHTVHDIVTDLVTISDDRKVSLEGFSTHFGTAEAARWFLHHELDTIRRCLEKYKGFRLRLVGHSLGGAAAALLAIMMRNKSKEELGFSPEIVSAVAFGTPPCVSKEVAEKCADYVSTVVLQDDIIPRLSAASLARLRNEIIETDWMTILEKEDWKGVVDIVTNAKLVVSSIQDVARKLADYASISSTSSNVFKDTQHPKEFKEGSQGTNRVTFVAEELFTPGTMYFLKREIEESSSNYRRSTETYTLWKRNPGEHFKRIMLSGNFISDHKCESHYYALRDVLKSLPRDIKHDIFLKEM
ncbi:Sn1-specific diacylglycerol lipase beta [Rhynchospora pubera]|uniref:Sn1-specific diacylglycerol lipase beta n=1 Tax=Rhynchospora pubera TaxID=906938 RepID=A0AAV8F1U8_9POAL|nr:Sn1-specific diacylglycerol lipase beta [Rhynchospora pubera]